MVWRCLQQGAIFSFLFIFALPLFAIEEIKFEKKTVWVGSHKLLVEVADTDKKTSRGLMYRHKKLKENEGMLFIFKGEDIRSFWMKNTFIPLSIGYFDKNKKLVSFTKMQPVRSEMERPKSYQSAAPAMYALEVSQGWFKRNKIKLGTKLKF